MTVEDKNEIKKLRDRLYYLKNKDKINIRQKIKRIEKREALKHEHQELIEGNQKFNSTSEYMKDYRKNHRQKAIIATNDWRKKNPEYSKLYQQLYSRKRNAAASHNKIKEAAYEDALNLLRAYWKNLNCRNRAEMLKSQLAEFNT